MTEEKKSTYKEYREGKKGFGAIVTLLAGFVHSLFLFPFLIIQMLHFDNKTGWSYRAVSINILIIKKTFNLNEYFRNGSEKERYLKNLNDAIKIIKEGIAVSKD